MVLSCFYGDNVDHVSIGLLSFYIRPKAILPNASEAFTGISQFTF